MSVVPCARVSMNIPESLESAQRKTCQHALKLLSWTLHSGCQLEKKISLNNGLCPKSFWDLGFFFLMKKAAFLIGLEPSK